MFEDTPGYGSAETLFLDDRKEKLFPEVLYLKLSFLGEVAMTLSTGNITGYPSLRLSLGSLWVKIADQSGLLPALWNFKVNSMTLGGPMASNAVCHESPSNSTLYFVGLVWFYALLVNKRQGITEVSRSLRIFLSGASSHGLSTTTLFGNHDKPDFFSCPIFFVTPMTAI